MGSAGTLKNMEPEKKVTEDAVRISKIRKTILKILADGELRSILSFSAETYTEGYTATEVYQAVNDLVDKGVVVENTIEGTIYYQRRLVVVKNNPMKGGTMPNVKKTSTDTELRVEDGIDLSIWKLMSDGVARNLDNIAATLSEAGFKYWDVRENLKTLLGQGTWFDRGWDSKQGPPVYSLKESCQRPDLPEVPKPEDIGYLCEEDLLGSELSYKLKTPLKTDDIMIQIWKIMSDFEFYTREEVILLLQELGHSVRISTLAFNKAAYDLHWFDRTHGLTDQRTKRYVLKKNLRMRKSSERIVDYLFSKAKIPSPYPNPFQDLMKKLPVADPNKPTGITASPIPTPIEAETTMNPTLLKIDTTISGKPFTLKEIFQLNAVIDKFLDVPMNETDLIKVEAKYQIKGISLNFEQLRQLKAELKAALP